jgi:hypothetical protein
MLLRVDTISSCCLRVRGPKVILFLFYFRKLPGVSPEFQSALVLRKPLSQLLQLHGGHSPGKSHHVAAPVDP